MIDFVHFNWISFKKEKPTKDCVCLLLIKNKKNDNLYIRTVPIILEYDLDGDMFAGTNDEYEIIAWADAENFAFDCNPEHYHECGKKDCDISNDCSTCHKTVKLEHAKWADWFR